MAEMALERGLLIHSSCIWRWVPIYGPELDKRVLLRKLEGARSRALDRNRQRQIVSPNSVSINSSCASESPLFTHLARPFRIMWTASICRYDWQVTSLSQRRTLPKVIEKFRATPSDETQVYQLG
jgi:hypothetical protein